VARERGDSIDVAALRSDCRQRIMRSVMGDVIEVEGCLRHRYWRGAGGLASRYEVEAERIRAVAKVRREPKAPGT
jgi:single-strand DNA-binding protein